MDLRDRYRGTLLGLAVADALGAQVEFAPPGSFPPVSKMTGGGPHRLPAGYWTDDTSLAICLAESLLECGRLDTADQSRRYLRWWRQGVNSSTGRCFDIGNTTLRALAAFERTGIACSGPEDAMSAGNGSVMRLAPVPLLFSPAGLKAVVEASAESSLATHRAVEAVDCCRLLGGLLWAALRGWPKADLLGERMRSALLPHLKTDAVRQVVAGSYLQSEPPTIQASGHATRTVEAALWALRDADDYEQAVLRAVNLGDDSDTVGAVCGQLAGALFGAASIPDHWISDLYERERLSELADRLLVAAVSKDSGMGE